MCWGFAVKVLEAIRPFTEEEYSEITRIVIQREDDASQAPREASLDAEMDSRVA